MKLTITILTACVLALFSAGYWAGARSRTQELTPARTKTLNLAAYDQVYENGRNAALREVALCTLEAARREVCALPCASDEDCLAKNGMTDH